MYYLIIGGIANMPLQTKRPFEQILGTKKQDNGNQEILEKNQEQSFEDMFANFKPKK